MNQHRNPDGTYNGVGVMSELTGLPRTTVQELADKARENIARLNACERHQFEPIGPVQPLRTRYRCAKCGGEVDSHARHWYERGLIDGGG